MQDTIYVIHKNCYEPLSYGSLKPLYMTHNHRTMHTGMLGLFLSH
jgi:hypothetical protein